MSCEPGVDADSLKRRGFGLLEGGEPAAAESCFREALARCPSDAAAWDGLGRALNNLRRLAEALAAFERAVGLDAGAARYRDHLGHALRALGRLAEAEAAFRAALAADPACLSARDNLASVLAARGLADEARVQLERAAAAAPGDPRRETNLGDLYRSAGDHEAAARAYARALAVEPGRVEALAGLGAARQAQGRTAEAGEAYRRALALSPGHPVAAPGLAALCELEGRAGDGLELIAPLLAEPVPREAVAITGARLLTSLGRPAEALRLLERLPAAVGNGPESARRLYVLGHVLDRLGRHAEAFQAVAAANRRADASFDPQGFESTVTELVAYFSAERMAALPRSGNASGAPVFIVGMPRSGTSLVEQMLAAHPAVLAAGERLALFEAVRTLAGGDPGERWPAVLDDTPPSRLAALAADYLVPLAGEGKRVLTDKLPTNFLNLGLAALLFPRARVVWCRRDPLDTGLSCFFQDFQSPGMSFTRSLAHIGVYMRACRRLMHHWRQVLDLPMLVLDYEAIVAAPEAAVRRLLGFLELPWHEGCLRFHEQQRVVRTASYGQVRRPLYSSSVHRHLPYVAWLEPLEEALGRGFRWQE